MHALIGFRDASCVQRYLTDLDGRNPRVAAEVTLSAAQAATLATELNNGRQVGPNDVASMIDDGSEDAIWFNYASGDKELVSVR